MLFDDWQALFRVTVVGGLAYIGLVLLLRISGKRTLAKWNAFDFVVTIALGSTLATVLLSKQVALAEGLLALGLLIALQFIISWSSQRCKLMRRLTKADPVYLYRAGQFLDENLQAERVTHSEVRAAVRGAGIAALEDVEAVVLETDGSVSVIKASERARHSALEDVAERQARH